MVARGMRPQLFEGFRKPIERLLARNSAFEAALQRTNDGRGAERAGRIDHFTNELARRRADAGVRVGQAQLAPDPAGSSAYGREAQLMLREDLLQFIAGDDFRRGGKNLDG